jgi:hypothetical protein
MSQETQILSQVHDFHIQIHYSILKITIDLWIIAVILEAENEKEIV